MSCPIQVSIRGKTFAKVSNVVLDNTRSMYVDKLSHPEEVNEIVVCLTGPVTETEREELYRLRDQNQALLDTLHRISREAEDPQPDPKGEAIDEDLRDF